MKIVLFVLASCSMQAARADLLMALEGIITGVGQVFSTTLTTNCTGVKEFFGIQYTQLNQSGKTPDLSRLTMDLYTTHYFAYYNLSLAAGLVLANPLFNQTLPITIFLHGFLNDKNSIGPVTMISTLLQRGKSNVLFLDASSVIFNLDYLRDSTAVAFIGETLGTQLAAFVNGGISPSNIHLIGHSLGAHISGFAGKTFTSLTGLTLGRISGLDPAGPCFYNEATKHILTSSDADFVDVIHTDAGLFGIIKPIGHVDFYPNGGADQPNCLVPPSGHGRSYELFAESLLHEDNFLAVRCADWSTFLTGTCNNNEQTSMGIAAPTTARGIFYLRTGGSSLFGMGASGSVARSFVDPVTSLLAWWNSLLGIK